MADPARAARLAQRIKVLVAEALRKEVKDERATAITVTDARVTNDLQHATIFYTILGDEETQKQVAEVLYANRGVLRREVGRNLTTRLTPTLEFVHDEIPQAASALEDLLRETKERDAKLAAERANAQYAGEADPYKVESRDETAGDDR
ncbi:30S ribosome-binding factor RbfA [Micrococcoides hystricis]|uniref:Ribosome-binding factor A n=1 Tax=Micrococcoides hystricis TaxID=1572761 RepID=A0ABV6P8P7_9MICC